MKRAIITIINDIMTDVYTHELNPECVYEIKCIDGDWIATVKYDEAGEQE